MNSTTAAVAAPLEPEVVEESAALRVELVVADPSRDDLVHDVVRDGTHGALLVTSRSTLSKARRRLRMARLLARARAMSRRSRRWAMKLPWQGRSLPRRDMRRL